MDDNTPSADTTPQSLPERPKPSNVLVTVTVAKTPELIAARKLPKPKDERACGCFIQMIRNPFYRGYVAHMRQYHPHRMRNVAHAQIQFLERLAREMTQHVNLPTWPDDGPGEYGTPGT